LNKAYAITTIELVLIALLGFCSYHFYSIASNSAGSNSDNPLVSSFKEPQPLTKEINDTTSLLNDLNSLGCKMFYLTSSFWFGNFVPQPINYTDFRRIAYNTGIVFLLLWWNGAECFAEIDGIPVQTSLSF
jgi:hypothetical protein